MESKDVREEVVDIKERMKEYLKKGNNLNVKIKEDN